MEEKALASPGRPSRLGGLPRTPILQPLGGRNFRLLWLGESVSLLGDQFYFVALTWLTLKLTGSGLALGTVLMAGAVPRAVFMLMGGALTDRFSSRALMLLSNALRAVLAALVTALVLAGSVRLWHLYLLAVAFGLVDAFFYPAYNSMLPRVVRPEQLEAGNALLLGTSQLTVLLGPASAGVLVARSGTAAAFAFDAATFVFATLTLLAMRVLPARSTPPSTPPSDRAPEPGNTNLLGEIRDGLRYAWGQPLIRAMLLLVAAIDFSFVGPMNVGIAALANRRFAGGAVALGAMLSAWGGGALVGTVLAGSGPRPRRRGRLLLLITAGLAVMFAPLGLAPSALVAAAAIAAMGLASGMLNVIGVAWLQSVAEPAMLGRVMSVAMFASQGLTPLSYGLAGALVDRHLVAMFMAAGALVLVGVVIAGSNAELRQAD